MVGFDHIVLVESSPEIWDQMSLWMIDHDLWMGLDWITDQHFDHFGQREFHFKKGPDAMLFKLAWGGSV